MVESKKIVVLGSEGYLEPYRKYLKSRGFDKFFAVHYNQSLDTTLELIKENPSLVLFTGGEDINPAMYGEQYSNIYFTPARDIWEETWFDFCVKHKIPMLGTCRGMQLFTILAGGKLFKNVTDHYSNHLVWESDSSGFMVNSLHHQMCIPYRDTFHLLAWAKNHTKRIDPACYINRLPILNKQPVEPEALYFQEVKALGFQWHPESMPPNSAAQKFVISCCEKYLTL